MEDRAAFLALERMWLDAAEIVEVAVTNKTEVGAG
jgi:hypothetical protein